MVSPDRVMSNAHVVAGSSTVHRRGRSGKTYDATVVSYDPEADISILDVPNLPSRPLQFAEDQAQTGTDVVVMGYPGGGEFTATPARIRETIKLNGPDIYHTTTGHPRGLHHQRQCAARQFGRPADRYAAARCWVWCSAPRSTTPTPASC